ncbi:MAG: hypothetical protein ACM3NR_00840 [Methanosarcina sp.]
MVYTLGKRQQATGGRRQATGKRQQATGDRRQATGDRLRNSPLNPPRGTFKLSSY